MENQTLREKNNQYSEYKVLFLSYRDLRSPGIISKHGGFRAPDGDSARVRERATWGDQCLEKLIPILYFPWSTFIH